MAGKLYITEYENVLQINGVSPIALEPALATQVVSYSTSTQSAAFNARTRFVRLHTDAICSIEFGTNPTATTSTRRMAAGQTEYFAVPPNASYEVAAIDNT